MISLVEISSFAILSPQRFSDLSAYINESRDRR